MAVRGSGARGQRQAGPPVADPPVAPVRTAATPARPTRAIMRESDGLIMTEQDANFEQGRLRSRNKDGSAIVFKTDIRVQATRLGYYGHLRRYAGDVFTLKAGDPIGSWMKEVAPGTPTKKTSANQDIKRHHDELLEARAGGAREDGADPTGAGGAQDEDVDRDDE